MKKFFTALLVMVLTSPLFANPDPSVTLQTSALTNPFPSTFLVNVKFSEPVKGFVPADVNVTNGTVVSIGNLPCPMDYTLVIQPNAAGPVSVFIPANVVVSLTTGSPNLASNLLSIPGASASPTLVLQTSTLSNPFPSTFPINVTFSEAVTGFGPEDVTVTNGTVVSSTGTNFRNFVVVIQPSTTGAMSALVPANAVVSQATGAPNLASNLLSIPAAISNPTVGLQTSTLTNPFPLSFPVNVTFSEAVTGFTSTDVNVTNGTVVSVTGTNLRNFVVVIQPNATGAVNAIIPANAVVSQATGAPNLASNLVSIPGAAINPTVGLQTSTLTNPFPLSFPINVAFSEAVTGFGPTDVNVNNGTVVSVTGTNLQNFVVVIQPNTTGAVSAIIPANAVVSQATGAPNLASNILNIPGTIASPTVVLQTNTSTNPSPHTFSINVRFSEAVTGFGPEDVTVPKGTVVSVTGTDLQNFVVVIQPNTTGAVDAFIPANSVVSQATGAPNLASNLLSIPPSPPASNFNLQPWSLTIPLPLGSQNNAVSIGRVTLNGTSGANNGYISPPYFTSDPTTGTMNFFAPLNGATTPGSEFARSELYEILPGASAYWKLSTFASNEMTASLLVTQVGPATHRTVIGQIHDKGNTDSFGHSAGNSPMVKVYYDADARDPNNNVCNGCIYAQVRITPSQSSFFKIVNLVQNIPLNTIFTYKVKILRDGTLTITANDVSTVIKLNTSTNNTIGWGTQQLYFKAGVYNLENGTSNTLGGAASFNTLDVKHT